MDSKVGRIWQVQLLDGASTVSSTVVRKHSMHARPPSGSVARCTVVYCHCLEFWKDTVAQDIEHSIDQTVVCLLSSNPPGQLS